MRLLVALLVAIGLAGCSIAKPAYNNVDYFLYRWVKSYADFDREQKRWLRAASKEFHHWHRTTQLPLYLDLLEDMQAQLQAEEAVFEAEWVDSTYQRMAGLMQSLWLRAIPDVVEFTTTFSDSQLHSLERKATREREREREKLRRKKSGGYHAEAAMDISSGFKRMGIRLSPQQLTTVERAALELTDINPFYLAARQRWDQQAMEIIRTRDQPGYAERFTEHMKEFRHLGDPAYRDALEKNTDLILKVVTRVLGDTSQDQRVAGAKQLKQWHKIIVSI